MEPTPKVPTTSSTKSRAHATSIDSDNESHCENNTCPICFEVKDNIQQIPHWESKGDISGHKMCADCAKQYTKNECPFCHEVSLKENILACIRDFIHQVRSKSVRGDPNELAAVLETWQFFEMEYGDNPRVIYRVAMLVLRDKEFKHLLESGVSTRAPWMRDAAGTIFRLYSLVEEGNLDVTYAEKVLLTRCYKAILELVRAPDLQAEGYLFGHFYGAIYSQAISPYMCALQSGQSTKHLETIVKEVGSLIVSQYRRYKRIYPQLKRTIPERIVGEYMPIVTANVWGGEHEDPVWKAFYKRPSRGRY